MEQSSSIPNPPTNGGSIQKEKFPALISSIAWLTLAGGILQIFQGLFVLIFSQLLGLSLLAIAVGWIVTSFGIRRRRLWGLYVFTLFTIAAILLDLRSVHSFFQQKDVVSIGTIVLEILFLAYLWSVRKKFS